MTKQIVNEYKRLSVVLECSVELDRVEWCDHVFCVDFYNKYCNSNFMQLLKSIDPFYLQVLSRYVNRSNLCLVENSKQLSCIDIEQCYSDEKKDVDVRIKEQYAKCKEAESKVDDIRKNIRLVKGERYMEVEQKMYRRLYDYHVGLLNTENSEFYRLADTVRSMDETFPKYNVNIFQELTWLNCRFIDAIESIVKERS